MKKTPIALFTYNRPAHASRALKSLSQCYRIDECQLYIYCDGPKSREEAERVNESRALVSAYAPALHAEVIMRHENRGLANSIVDGVTDLCKHYGRVIVVEDDLVLSRDFIDYMLLALDRYEHDRDVYQIAGFMYPVDNPPAPDAFFLPFMSSWGWGTWDRSWGIYDRKAAGWEKKLSGRRDRKRFDLDGGMDFYHMLKQTINGNIDTWDILWYYQIFIRGGLALYPRTSLVWNGGFDGSGTNCGSVQAYQPELAGFEGRKLSGPPAFPEKVEVDTEALGRVKKYLKGTKPSWLGRLLGRARSII